LECRPSPRESPAEVDHAAASSPALPSPTLAVPRGNQLAFALEATGVQIYACRAEENGYGWSLQAPEATLVDKSGEIAIKHYAGPTWEWLGDGSKVKATKVAAFSPDPGSIAALLLQVSEHEGQGRMSDLSFIQRLETKRGLAPSAGCDAAHIGELSRADYTATYYFYRPEAAH
jgi:hypothetical protein